MEEIATLFELLRDWENIITGFGSLLLSAVLAGLYYKQHGVLKKQLEKDTNPEIVTEEINISESTSDISSPLDCNFVYTLSNIGRGRANELAVRIIPELVGEYDVQLHTTTKEMRRVWDSDDGPAMTAIDSGGNYLEGGERGIQFAVWACAGSFFLDSDVVTRGGHLLLSELPEPVAEVERGERISASNFPNLEHERKTKYHLSLKDEDNVATILDTEPDVESLPIEVEEIERERLKGNEVEEIVNESVGTLFVRIKHVLEFYDSDGEKHEKELMDRVFPSRFGVTDEILYTSGITYDRFQLKGDKKSMIERNLYSNLQQTTELV